MTVISQMCNLCHKPRPQLGGGLRLVLGFRMWVCAKCKEGKK